MDKNNKFKRNTMEHPEEIPQCLLPAIPKSSTHVGRTNIFEMDIPTIGPPFAHKLCSIPLKHQKFVNEDIRLPQSAGFISRSLSLQAAPVIIVPQNPDPSHPNKPQLCLAIDY